MTTWAAKGLAKIPSVPTTAVISSYTNAVVSAVRVKDSERSAFLRSVEVCVVCREVEYQCVRMWYAYYLCQ